MACKQFHTFYSRNSALSVRGASFLPSHGVEGFVDYSGLQDGVADGIDARHSESWSERLELDADPVQRVDFLERETDGNLFRHGLQHLD